MLPRAGRMAKWGVKLFAVLLVAASFGSSQAAKPSAKGPLDRGVGTFLQQSPQYSLFLRVVHALNGTSSYEDQVIGWFAGPTSQTMLLVNNGNLRKGFADLAKQYKIRDPSTFVDRLIKVANGSGTTATFALSAPFAAAVVLLAFANSHTLPGSSNFYSNSKILGATFEKPVKVSTSFSSKRDADLSAYAAADAPGPITISLRQPASVLKPGTGAPVPRKFVSATGPDAGGGSSKAKATVYVYELDRVFVFGGTFGAADASSYSTDMSLKFLAKNKF